MELDELDAQNQHTGYPIAPLVRQIVGACGEHGRYVHWGATTQDILNTALAMQANEAFNLLAQDLRAIIARLAALTNEHRDTLMVARTFGGHALPITFGFKVAVWLSAGLRHAERLEPVREGGVEQMVRAGPDVDEDERPEMDDREAVGVDGTLRGLRDEDAGGGVVFVDRALVGTGEGDGAGDDGRQHRVELERGVQEDAVQSAANDREIVDLVIRQTRDETFAPCFERNRMRSSGWH